jgi:hypothetical protein
MTAIIWSSPGWTEGLLLAAAICAAVLTAIELAARATTDALLPATLCLIALALLAA